MHSTVFVALQCCQCSTMQVKQQKKSSNKWVCVVCNQKQSVRKVFAQGYKAKELRVFVQSFNMSRKSVDEELTPENTKSKVNEDGGVDDRSSADQTKRRTDWNEYLDPPDHHHRSTEQGEGDQEEGGGFELKIVTEMPKEMFKKPRLNPSATEEEDKKSGHLKRAMSKTALKWNAYITREEDDDPQASRRRNSMDDIEEWSRAVCEISTNQRVEDDIHPDFM